MTHPDWKQIKQGLIQSQQKVNGITLPLMSSHPITARQQMYFELS